MTCDKVLKYLFAFLDNELESGLSIEVQAHLEHCPVCAREAEIERAVRRGLDGALGGGRAPEFDEQVMARSLSVSEQRRPARPTRVAWFLGSALAAAAAIALVVYLWPHDRARHFIDVVAQESEHFLMHAGPVQLPTNEVGTLTLWLRDQTAMPVEVADASGSGWHLVGGRRCLLNGRLAAFALFEREGKAASVVAVSDGDADMGNLKRTPCGDEVHWVGRCNGKNIVANRRGGLVYYAVSDHPASVLHDLVMEPQR